MHCTARNHSYSTSRPNTCVACTRTNARLLLYVSRQSVYLQRHAARQCWLTDSLLYVVAGSRLFFQPVLARYEDDRHYPVDKSVGAGAQDNARSQHGCSGDSCPAGDRTNPVHHKQRCPAGTVVAGIESMSGDWLDSITYICAPLVLMSQEEARLRELDIAAEEQAAMQAVLNKLAGLAALG